MLDPETKAAPQIVLEAHKSPFLRAGQAILSEIMKPVVSEESSPSPVGRKIGGRLALGTTILVAANSPGLASAQEQTTTTPEGAAGAEVSWADKQNCLKAVLGADNVRSVKLRFTKPKAGTKKVRGPFTVTSLVKLNDTCVANSKSPTENPLHWVGNRTISEGIQVRKRGKKTYGDPIVLNELIRSPSDAPSSLPAVPNAINQVNLTSTEGGNVSRGTLKSRFKLMTKMPALRNGDRVRPVLQIRYNGIQRKPYEITVGGYKNFTGASQRVIIPKKKR